ncbi:MAG: HD domain-containing protein [Deltaproteobacteria bacterium]|nr:HD domain-containing protein [Deltaproteobacteria bacterium]
MKECFAANVKEHDTVEDLFLVKVKNLSVGKTGKPYLVVSLMDKTGELEGRVWDDAERMSGNFEVDDFVHVKGRVSAYMGKLQLKISTVTRVDDNEVSLDDFLPSSAVSPEVMFSELAGLVETVKDPHIKKLLLALMEDRDLSQGLKNAPAAKGMHHVYIGGLLEHVLSLCRLINLVSSHYGERINRDLLLAGAIFHDIGKTRELSYKRSFGYTDEGRLVGHITIGVEILDGLIRSIDGFPAELSMLLKHMILSHHGEYEYGSPKRPKTLEATILSYLDDLDAKVNSIQSLIDGENGNGTNWTGYHRLFERYIYKGNGMEAGEDVPHEKIDEQKKSPPAADTPKGKTLTLFGN